MLFVKRGFEIPIPLLFWSAIELPMSGKVLDFVQAHSDPDVEAVIDLERF